MGSEPSSNSLKPPMESSKTRSLSTVEESKSSSFLTNRPALIPNSKSNQSITPRSTRLQTSQSVDIDANDAVQPVPKQLPIALLAAPNNRKSRRSSVSMIRNGITGTYISGRVCAIAAKFWHQHVDTLSVAKQLEVGCSIFFGMLSANEEMKKVMKANLKHDIKIEQTSLKYLDMLGFLCRYLITDNMDLHALLQQLGVMHQAMGIKLQHFDPMLQAMHETFSYYFDHEYTIEVKYAFDEIFALSAQIMTGNELNGSSHLMALSEQFQGNEIPFLKSLDVCLQSNIGKEYLYRYLQQTWCDEMVIFLQTLSRFKSMTSDKERFMVAREINKTCIEPSAAFALNISFEQRTNALKAMQELEQKFVTKESLEISSSLFSAVELEVRNLIESNHWLKFVDSIRALQHKSCSAE